ncbi:hypothetical protein NUW54_g11825 [Trametes sanguinea]|uniref:Uncharacterized protein n=1 Tax=Trametes sanguinea TaxID=158606 RepID=A0ACC1N7M4_9APHY|nr:hypothetical protein NUW54_g11825 [Trametes sanguinea]
MDVVLLLCCGHGLPTFQLVCHTLALVYGQQPLGPAVQPVGVAETSPSTFVSELEAVLESYEQQTALGMCKDGWLCNMHAHPLPVRVSGPYTCISRAYVFRSSVRSRTSRNRFAITLDLTAISLSFFYNSRLPLLEKLKVLNHANFEFAAAGVFRSRSLRHLRDIYPTYQLSTGLLMPLDAPGPSDCAIALFAMLRSDCRTLTLREAAEILSAFLGSLRRGLMCKLVSSVRTSLIDLRAVSRMFRPGGVYDIPGLFPGFSPPSRFRSTLRLFLLALLMQVKRASLKPASQLARDGERAGLIAGGSAKQENGRSSIKRSMVAALAFLQAVSFCSPPNLFTVPAARMMFTSTTMHAAFSFACFILSLGLLERVAAFDLSRKDNLAVYWGQDSAGNQQRLSHYCKDSTVDTFPIAFLYIFRGAGGEPVIDFANVGGILCLQRSNLC